MDIKYPIENEYMKCVLQINGFSGPCPRVRSNRRVWSGGGGATLSLLFSSIMIVFALTLFNLIMFLQFPDQVTIVQKLAFYA